MAEMGLQDLCELGQRQLVAMDYLSAQKTLADAEHRAWRLQDWDTLSRLYMPLQEARRQIRQRCGEGIVVLDLIAQSTYDHLNGERVVQNHAQGQLLVAGWGSTEAAADVRRLASRHQLYLETFLAAAYPLSDGTVAAVIVPTEETQDLLPPPAPRDFESLRSAVPPDCLVIAENALPRGSMRGTTQTYAQVMALWERLHTPWLARADAQADPIARMEGYRRTIEVDSACELAHQKLSDTARQMLRAHLPGKSAG